MMAVLPLAAQAGKKAPDLNTIIKRLEQAQRENRGKLEAYETVRRYQFFSGDDKDPASTVIADVQFVPPAAKSYSIEQTTGGRSTGVVRRILDREVESAGKSVEHDISRRNYDFQYLGAETKDGVFCYVLKLTPKREDKSLVDGKAWIDASNYLPWRVEGTVAKSPSWWVKQLDVELQFAPVDGMWLQTGGVGRADIRIFGLHTVVSRDLEHRVGAQMASRRHARRPDALLGAGFPQE